ncbi:MAG: CpcT/CpeT family chromophore lyase [Thermaurantiacus sp.]
MESADPSLARAPAAGFPYRWLDRQHAQFREVQVPGVAAAGDRSIYLEWRSGGPEGPVSRQRLWVFRTQADGKGVMDFFAFRAPETLAGAAGTPERFATLGPEDLVGYGQDCALPVTQTPSGWSAYIPGTCRIRAQSGREMTLSAEIRLDEDILSYEEVGILADGSTAFRVPGGVPYRFTRIGP